MRQAVMAVVCDPWPREIHDPGDLSYLLQIDLEIFLDVRACMARLQGRICIVVASQEARLPALIMCGRVIMIIIESDSYKR